MFWNPSLSAVEALSGKPPWLVAAAFDSATGATRVGCGLKKVVNFEGFATFPLVLPF